MRIQTPLTIIERAQNYFTTNLRYDMFAGLTVAMVMLPQAMAYAVITGVDPLFGLFTAVLGTISAGLFSRTPYLISGSTNPTALATAGVLIAFAGQADYAEYVFAVGILTGLILVVLGITGFGHIANFISNAVLTGFLAGIGVLIIINQVDNLLGIHFTRTGRLPVFIEQFWLHIVEINMPSIIVGVVTILGMLILRRYLKGLPSALVVVLAVTILAAVFNWRAQGLVLVNDLTEISFASFKFHIPELDWQVWQEILRASVTLAIFILVITFSVAKALSISTGKHPDLSELLKSVGASGFLCGFFQCLPVSVSPSRTAVNIAAGARTRYASVLSGLFLLLFVLFFRHWIGMIPIPCLAGIVIVSAFSIVSVDHVILTWRSASKSKIVMLTTFAATLFLPIEYAIYFGALLSIGIFLNDSSKININCLECNKAGEVIEIPFRTIREVGFGDIIILNIEGSLFFGAVENFQRRFSQVVDQSPQVIILRLRTAHNLASSALAVLADEIQRAQKSGIRVLLSGITQEQYDQLEMAGILELLAEDHIYRAKDVRFASLRNAFEHAEQDVEDIEKGILGSPEDGITGHDETPSN